MMLNKALLFIAVILFSVTTRISFAQESRVNQGLKRNVAQILFSTLGGAVLGLSTLSFYGEPQEHTNNISVGALLGFAAGTGYVLYNSTATKTYDPYKEYSYQPSSTQAAKVASFKSPVLIQFQFDF